MAAQYPLQTIDLAALRENVRLIRESVPQGTKLLVSIKADAYGHGMIEAARNALQAGADWFAVARTGEGVRLRQAGIDAPVLVLGESDEEQIAEGVRHRLTLTVCTSEDVRALQKAADESSLPAMMHLKMDTGMGRIGVKTEAEIRRILDSLEKCPDVRLMGAFTHFADADGDTDDYTRLQLERFQRLLKLLPDGILRHCANSAAIHRYPEATMDMVRAGISMYGCPPVQTALPLQPVMDWRTVVTFVHTAEPGDKISYGCTYTAERPMVLATVACGYGDGYHRAASGKAEVIIHGRRVPVVGRICMDQMMVDVTDVAGVAAGDEVMLMGRQGEECITADELASWAGTISYEVLLAATARVRRVWVNDRE